MKRSLQRMLTSQVTHTTATLPFWGLGVASAMDTDVILRYFHDVSGGW